MVRMGEWSFFGDVVDHAVVWHIRPQRDVNLRASSIVEFSCDPVPRKLGKTCILNGKNCARFFPRSEEDLRMLNVS